MEISASCHRDDTSTNGLHSQLAAQRGIGLPNSVPTVATCFYFPRTPAMPERSGTMTPSTAAALSVMTESLRVLVDSSGVAAALLVHAEITPSTAQRQDRHIVIDVKADSFGSGMASGLQAACMCAMDKNSGNRIITTVLKSNSMDK